ncbi:WD repeat protein, human WDR55 family, involved in ribosome biogenesis [Schizosaccharomyces pombe]|uniref:Uncharacterized WD repeat-containing protein C1A6.02 n=1 Tax=Schizosaccharomyces pombe (strain 972 / ATCC 24843) TaxID=284812 RepID=YEX2_SCHPO|nr:WD repeat-containing protein [Schizosaccharomyces pombe]O13856.1 RecName: Full=Uncharacterized WD repeat-containing protein C1A6.02 [Schizosaccharomyces pombe 972h-]CAB16892.2 WD repeat protein, human WDR55 family, involved in ribosome biogenesis (predicted) [Schizosaccharomyces pombe]|eukprot:NP_001342873.1 WD repeat-containing protein [Schizosaccharomyces pombe]
MGGTINAAIKQKFENEIFDLACFGENQVLLGFSNGRVSSYQYDVAQISLVEQWSTKRHKKSCRNISVNESGTEFISVGSDGVLKIADTSTGRVSSKWIVDKNKEISPYSVVQWIENDMVFATGDDNGCVSVWDKRTEGGIIHTHNDHIDYISSISPFEERYFVATSGDGVLSVIDARNFKKPILSEEQDEEMTCGAFTRDQHSKKKFAVGTASGVITLFTKGDWGDHTDRILSPIRSHDFSIETITRADSDSLYVGGSDGCIRLLHILPNKYERIIGQHSSRSTVDAVDVTTEGNFLVSCSGTELAFWPVDQKEGDESSSSDNLDSDEDSSSDSEFSSPKKKKKVGNQGKKPLGTDFFDGL